MIGGDTEVDLLNVKDIPPNVIEEDSQIEFFDIKYVTTECLSTDNSALEYFYNSPFYNRYRDKALNELIRAGKTVDGLQSGYIFTVSWSNISIIEKDAPTDQNAKIAYYSVNSIFHITLFSRYSVPTGLITNPIRLYCILGGRIYSCPSKGSVIRHLVYESVLELDKMYNRIREMSEWDFTSGYKWIPRVIKYNDLVVKLSKYYNYEKFNEEESGDKIHTIYNRADSTSGIRIAQEELLHLNLN